MDDGEEEGITGFADNGFPVVIPPVPESFIFWLTAWEAGIAVVSLCS